MTMLIYLCVAYIVNCHRVLGHITYIEARDPLTGYKSAPGSPWPMPRQWINSSILLTLDPKRFNIHSNFERCDVIQNAIRRYRRLIFSKSGDVTRQNVPLLDELEINIENEDCEDNIQFEADESYELDVQEGEAIIQALSIWGALRGLETFSQLVYEDDRGKYLLNQTRIKDSPRFRHRGIMLDTARHFIPMSILYKTLDAMSYNKFNVFHWHIVDDQSFPYESRSYPELTAKGAYSPLHTYSQRDVSKLIKYARLRGIRVIPEFDTPGHTQSWGKAFPHLLTPCWVDGKEGSANYTEHHTHEIFNPVAEQTYKFLETFYEEIVHTFPDKYVHLGMDEVYYSCWRSNPDIQQFMDQQGFREDEMYRVEQFYMKKVMAIVDKLEGNSIIWQDPIETGAEANRDTIVQVWKDTSLWVVFQSWQNYSRFISSQGHRMILSACWYLNYIGYGPDWEHFYNCEPYSFTDNADDQLLMLGGEACLWSEYVDGTNLLSTLWPRASAVAERLWSTIDVRDVNAAKFRLDEHRCRMVKRGIPAQPILTGYCGDYDVGFQDTLEVENSSSTFLTSQYFIIFFTLISLICRIGSSSTV